nr:phage holin [uncultured Agathobaculum sp.]
MNITAGTLARTIILALALINQVLSATGHAVLPIENSQVETLVSTAWTVIASLITWWKNNSFIAAAKAGDVVMKREGESKRENPFDCRARRHAV